MARRSFILLPVERTVRPPRWMSPSHHRRLLAVAAVVRTRTCARVWIDVVRREAMFGYVSPVTHARRLAFGFPLYRKGGEPARFDKALDDVSVDDVCWLLQIGKVDQKVKDRWKRQWDQRREHERQEAIDRDWEAHGAREAEDFAKREYERACMGPHFRRAVVVDGLRPVRKAVEA